ncbi:hypothetical protein V2J09_009139 [Rumex salicifolius]
MAFNSSLQITGSSSSPTNRLRPSGSMARQEEPCVPFSSLLQGGNFATKDMVCRRWDASNTSGNYISTEFILSDYEGGEIHCVAQRSIAHCFTSKLEVGQFYSPSRFSVLPNKETYRLRNSKAHLIHLEGNSLVRKIDCPPNSLMRFLVQLVVFENIALNNSRFLIGSVVNIGRVKPTRNGSQFLEFELMNESTSATCIYDNTGNDKAADGGHLEADDNEIPHEVLELVDTSHVLELKTHTFYDHGAYESFTASRLPHPGPEDPNEMTSVVLANDAVPRLPTLSTISDDADLDAVGSDGENCKDKYESLHKKRPAKLDDEETSAEVPLHCVKPPGEKETPSAWKVASKNRKGTQEEAAEVIQSVGINHQGLASGNQQMEMNKMGSVEKSDHNNKKKAVTN